MRFLAEPVTSMVRPLGRVLVRSQVLAAMTGATTKATLATTMPPPPGRVTTVPFNMAE